MPQEWVYLVNDRSDNWGYPVTAMEFFAGARDPGPHQWHVARRLRGFGVGDYLWVRASAPTSAFVGLGQVASDLQPDGDLYVFDVAWDAGTCERLAAHPVPGVLETHTRTARRLTDSEVQALHAAVGGLPTVPPVPAGKVRRLQEVTQRQGPSR